MKTKDTVRELLDRLPDDCSLDDILYHLYVIQKVDRGLTEADSGRTIPHEEVAEELKKTNPRRKVEFVIQPNMEVKGDAGLLRIFLDNLLGNAWKFSGKKPHAKIEFGVQQSNAKNTYFVRDNGAGFDMAHADKLFDPFHRQHNKQEFKGTGIGLATAQRIIHRHGGKIWAEATPDKGATFYFTLN